MCSAPPCAGRARCMRKPGCSNAPVSSSELYSRCGPNKRSTPCCMRTPPSPSMRPNSALYLRTSPKIESSSRLISALPRAVNSTSLTPSICSASMVMGPGSSALLVCARAGAAASSASASVAKRYPMERAAMLLMLEFSMIHADSRRAALESWLAAQLRGARFSLTPASVDASFRRYFRAALPDGRSYVVMDAPPGKEDCRPFVHVAGLLRAAGVHAPEVHAEDLARGFLLLGDLGTRTYLQELNADNAARLLGEATDALLRWQLATRPGELPPYDEALLRREMDLFPEWYVARHRRKTLSNAQKSRLEGIFRLLVESALAQPAVYVHRDYMPRNLMVSDPNPGVLDFQDAVLGPITYDMVSLLRDAFVSWDDERVLDWSVRYWEKAKRAGLPVDTDFAEFWRAFEWMGLQRHLKVLGIFARIAIATASRNISPIRRASSATRALCPRATPRSPRSPGCSTSSNEGHAPRGGPWGEAAAPDRRPAQGAGRGGRQAAHRLAPRAAGGERLPRGRDQRVAPRRANRRAHRRRRALRPAHRLLARAAAARDRGRPRPGARAARR